MLEAAEVDGARFLQKLRLVILPMLLPAVFLALVLRTMDAFRLFDSVFVTTKGGPEEATDVLQFYAVKQGLEFFNVGYASSLVGPHARLHRPPGRRLRRHRAPGRPALRRGVIRDRGEPHRPQARADRLARASLAWATSSRLRRFLAIIQLSRPAIRQSSAGPRRRSPSW